MPGTHNADRAPVADRVSRSQLIVISSAGARLILTLAVTFLVGRALAPDEFGFFGLVIVILVVARELMELGTGSLATREIAIHPERERTVIETLMGLRALVGLLLGLVILALALAQDEPHRTWILFATAAFLPLLCVGAQTVVFLVRQDQGPPAAAAVALQVIFLAACVTFYFGNAPAWSYAAAVIAREVAGIFWLSCLTSKKLRFMPRPRWRPDDMRRMLGQVTAFSAAALSHKLYFYTGPLLIWLLLTPADMGAYSAAFRPISALAAFPWLLAVPLLPGLARLARHDRPGFRQQVAYLVPFSLGLGAIAGVAGYVLSADALILLYGDRYLLGDLSAVSTLKLLSLSVAFATASATVITMLMADGRERSLVPLTFAGLAATIFLNVVFLPTYGFVAAAAATLIVEACIWVIAVIGLLRTSAIPQFQVSTFSPILPASFLILAFQLLPSSPGWERLVIGTALALVATIMLLQLPVVRRGRKHFSEVDVIRAIE